MACGWLTFPTYRLVPDARWHVDAPRIGARSDARHPRGIEVQTVGAKALKRYGLAAGTSRSVNRLDPGFRRVARHGLLAAYRRC